MKIKEFKFKQILKLHLLNSRAYEHLSKKSHQNFFNDFNLTQIISSFKRSLHVIYCFHSANKKILFIGVPKKLELKINKLTSHLAVPKNFDLQSIISSNQKQQLKKANRSVDSRSLMPKLVKKPDLIVLFFSEKRESITNESYSMKIPLVTFRSESVLLKSQAKSSYNVQFVSDNFNSVQENNFLFLGLNFLFRST